jgi:hypothetical protein
MFATFYKAFVNLYIMLLCCIQMRRYQRIRSTFSIRLYTNVLCNVLWC